MLELVEEKKKKKMKVREEDTILYTRVWIEMQCRNC